MKKSKINIGNLFLLSALSMLALCLCFGILAAITYIFPYFLKNELGFVSLRPLHVSSAIFWLILGATGCVYNGLQLYTGQAIINNRSLIQWGLWILAIVGILFSYCIKKFGGREYWEFDPIWALPIVIAWVLFLINFISIVRKIKSWPVYIWMWLTGIVFFLFTFLENYLWIFPFFREHFITDMTIQWKVNGSLVGSWNQILYGTAIFLMDKIEGTETTGNSKQAFFMYFLGLFNLMFNWGHHLYTLPGENYIRYIGYIVSMTEWIFFIKIIYDWKKSVSSIQKNYHYFPFRFLMATDIWVFLNMIQALLMSIPAINIYTHGTHVTVAHAMGTTIGINSMILFAACFEFFNFKYIDKSRTANYLNKFFWGLQISLFIFWLSLNAAGVKKGIWQMSLHQVSYSEMMESLRPYFIVFGIAGIGLLICFSSIAILLIKNASIKNEIYEKYN
ncbi:MAG: cbb3-type cytochrome c oxidase subunit I [Bacteroidia bacterium]